MWAAVALDVDATSRVVTAGGYVPLDRDARHTVVVRYDRTLRAAAAQTIEGHAGVSVASDGVGGLWVAGQATATSARGSLDGPREHAGVKSLR